MTPAVGQWWERPNGSRFQILILTTVCGREYVGYWLKTGSRPQCRYIAVQNLKRYKLISA